MYHYVYKITNLLDHRIYIGVHSTENLDDRYMGSCGKLSKDIKKLGKDKFKKEILYFFDTREAALQREREIVNYEFITRPDTYNGTIGGNFKGIGLVPVRDKNNNTFMIPKTDPRYISGEFKHVIKGKKYDLSKEELERRSLLGKQNSNIRRVTNGEENKSVHYTELDDFLKNNPGWWRGQTQHWSKESIFKATRQGKHVERIKNAKIKRKKRLEEKANHIRKHYTGWKWVTNGHSNKKIKKEQLEEFLSLNQDYKLGHTGTLTVEGRNHLLKALHSMRGKINITLPNGKRTKVFADELQNYKGSFLGWNTKRCKANGTVI